MTTWREAEIERLADVVAESLNSTREDWAEAVVHALLKALRDINTDDGFPRYTAGLWSGRNLDALIDDLLDEKP